MPQPRSRLEHACPEPGWNIGSAGSKAHNRSNYMMVWEISLRTHGNPWRSSTGCEKVAAFPLRGLVGVLLHFDSTFHLRYSGRLKKIAMGRCVRLTKAPVLMKESISQQEHQELLLAALAILRVVLRARSSARLGGCSAPAWAASSSASSRRNPRAILVNRLCSCAIGFAWYFVM